jgi:hypothetical protein
VIEDSGAGSIVATVLSGQGGYKPGRVKQRERVSLSSEQVQEFLELIELINYWEMPGSDHSNIGFDGAQWILEGARDGEYHVVDRWSPEHGEYRTTCLQLLEWSGLNVENKY